MAPKRQHDDDQLGSDSALKKRAKVQIRTPGTVFLMRNINQALLRTAKSHDNDATTDVGDPSEATAKSGQLAAQVFGTTELLEKILVDVGNVKDLVRMRGVSSKWRDVIECSPSLKAPLFLAPEQAGYEWHGHRVTMLVKRPKGSIIASPNRSTIPPTVVFKSVWVNPLLLYKDPEHSDIPIWRPKYANLPTPYDWTSQELYLRKEIKPRHIKTNSILIVMFATQPPVFEVILRTYNSDHDHAARKIRNRRGVRVIDVLRAAGEVAGRRAIVVDNVFFPPETTETIIIANFHREQAFWVRC